MDKNYINIFHELADMERHRIKILWFKVKKEGLKHIEVSLLQQRLEDVLYLPDSETQ